MARTINTKRKTGGKSPRSSVPRCPSSKLRSSRISNAVEDFSEDGEEEEEKNESKNDNNSNSIQRSIENIFSNGNHFEIHFHDHSSATFPFATGINLIKNKLVDKSTQTKKSEISRDIPNIGFLFGKASLLRTNAATKRRDKIDDNGMWTIAKQDSDYFIVYKTGQGKTVLKGKITKNISLTLDSGFAKVVLENKEGNGKVYQYLFSFPDADLCDDFFAAVNYVMDNIIETNVPSSSQSPK
ncbi:hypothetical protein TRFO_04507 [Tritrichomonas foetus]|uniref:RanBD1 domain-containing protein n=1 Tax=Tritrichomonas foetus TaxID=1144522 RepID=A0A1J4KI05_9EUKA|nr:hypothetical protein TRFO_04507 [Tritrichomonas foetus]|eukprot:OHT09452.1 hypothetical protein TRFO_04507 [Tritrichomonas foetus]